MKKEITDTKVPILSWCEEMDAGAMEQAVNVANHPAAFHHVAVMPDCHQGYGMPIGGVAAMENAVSPNMVGVDIGCGMCAVQTSIPAEGVKKSKIRAVLKKLKKFIPVGFGHHKKTQLWKKFDQWKRPEWLPQKSFDLAKKSLGTLGGGNHFMEIQRGDDGFLWLMLHSGSRNLGKTIAERFHRLAMDLNESLNMLPPVKDLAYLYADSEEGMDYIDSMNFALDFAAENRKRMMLMFKGAVTDIFGGKINFTREINIHHNYAAMEEHFGTEVWVHRKGATSAKKREFGIIPGSMGTPSYIVMGMGNPDSFGSCSHGAGRRMGRNQATRNLTKEECDSALENVVYEGFARIKRGKLKGLYDLGEAPAAYKDIDDVIKAQSDLIKPMVALTPLGVIKG